VAIRLNCRRSRFWRTWSGGCMAATEIVAVLDAGPLIHLDELGRLDLLSDFNFLAVIVARAETEVI
jgi:hypothetical protein